MKLLPFNIKMKLVSYKKYKTEYQSNYTNQTQQILNLIFIPFSVNLPNYECL